MSGYPKHRYFLFCLRMLLSRLTLYSIIFYLSHNIVKQTGRGSRISIVLVSALCYRINSVYTVKPVLLLSSHSERRPKLVSKTDYRLMQVKIIAECSKAFCIIYIILLTFIKLPFVIKISVLSILSGRLRQVLLYIKFSNP